MQESFLVLGLFALASASAASPNGCSADPCKRGTCSAQPRNGCDGGPVLSPGRSASLLYPQKTPSSHLDTTQASSPGAISDDLGAIDHSRFSPELFR